MPEPVSSPFKLLPTPRQDGEEKERAKRKKTISKPRRGFFLFFLKQTHCAQVS